MLSQKEVLDRHSEMKAVRQLEEPQWREIAVLMRPEDTEIGLNNNLRQRVADDIFDSTALLAVDEFESGFFNQASSPADRWMALGLEDKDLAKFGPVQKYLWDYTNAIFSTASPTNSAFYVNLPAVFGNAVLFGLGALYSAEDPKGGYLDLAIPLSETYIDTDGQGYLTNFNREFKVTGRQAKRQFGDSASKFDDAKQFTIVHAVSPNPDYDPQAIGPKGMEFSSAYVSPDDANFRLDKGYYEMPYHTLPWRGRPGRVYGLGQGHITRADANSLNLMERSHLVAAEYAAEPPILLHDQSVITASDMNPNAFLYGSINEDGKQLVQTFSRGGDVKLSMEQSQQRRMAIKDAFKFSLMQLLNRPQMTATEFLGQKATQMQLLAPSLARAHKYLLATWTRRRARMLQRAGLAPPPPPEMQGQKVEVDFVSPLAKAQKSATGQVTLQWLQGMEQLAQAEQLSGQPPTSLDNIDPDGTALVLHESFGAPPGTLRDPRIVAQIRAQRAQAQQQQVQLQNAGQVATVAATASHAVQAATLANGRVGGPQGSGRPN